MFSKKVNILGTEYKIIYQTQNENPKLVDANGLCECYSKELILNFADLDDPDSFANIDEYKKKVLRHEIMHAFLFEAGLMNKYSRDELLVDSLAILIPKICNSMKEVGCLE